MFTINFIDYRTIYLSPNQIHYNEIIFYLKFIIIGAILIKLSIGIANVIRCSTMSTLLS